MEYDKKLEICIKEFAMEFSITEKQAEKIIKEFDLEDELFQRYEDTIKEAEEEQSEEWQDEIDRNHDLYFGDIHGGIDL